MYVALKDLEIRGAGNLLGGEQSGHIAGVGFDLYIRMIGEAVRELKDDAPAERPEVRVELPVNAHIPHDYIPGERLRLAAYTSIASIDSEDDVVVGPRRAARPLRRAAGARGDAARRGAAAVRGAAGRADGHHAAGVARAVRARLSCLIHGWCEFSGYTPRRCSSRRCVPCWYQCRSPAPQAVASAGSRCVTPSCSLGARRLSVRYCPSRRFAAVVFLSVLEGIVCVSQGSVR